MCSGSINTNLTFPISTSWVSPSVPPPACSSECATTCLAPCPPACACRCRRPPAGGLGTHAAASPVCALLARCVPGILGPDPGSLGHSRAQHAWLPCSHLIQHPQVMAPRIKARNGPPQPPPVAPPRAAPHLCRCTRALLLSLTLLLPPPPPPILCRAGAQFLYQPLRRRRRALLRTRAGEVHQ